MPDFIDTDHKNIIELDGISQSYDGGKNWIIKDLRLLGRR